MRAFFGDKYGDPVRVLRSGREAVGDGLAAASSAAARTCDHTGQIGFFKIVGEEAVGKGVRRLTAVTGREAVEDVQRLDAILADLTGRFRCQPEDLPARVDGLQEEIKKLQQQLKKGAATDLPGRGRQAVGRRPPR